MLKQLILENWKSFRYAVLPLDPLTVLIGTNASGKSNVVEALEFLQRIVKGREIEDVLAGYSILPSIQGGVDWVALKPETNFTLKALVQGNDENTDYLYSITVKTKPIVQVLEETIITQIYQEKNHESSTQDSIVSDLSTSAKYPHSKINISNIKGMQRESMLNMISKFEIANKDFEDINLITDVFENVFVLNPIAFKMRDYSPLSDNLESNASNIAGVLAALDDEQKTEVESTLSAYIKDFTERDIRKVFAEPVGRLRTDAILYCEEEWKPGEITLIDAKTMSDGTLRFIAILTALLTRPEGSQIVIEEIDNGLHPSRAELLVRILREIGSKRKIDILLTTHNPALLDALGPEIVPFVVVAHRDKETGESKLTLLEDIENLPLLLASGTLGRLATKGAIEKSLSDNK
ncbi:MAG: AAA family ATPase [Nostoc sp. NMS1]|uniref:AAA family ATPase n=1 Tax=unclassified Nostoc TaxID=2593658 RepID=UPI0025E239A8|nr:MULTISPECIES: ATP-binding protein [unclassified Nostoc]MBN3910338.1 AAA family ATPase [Nostoc sp. NMS1]MBN3989968.1 AAA family ATPase [Nostoc sp. NMS2]